MRCHSRSARSSRVLFLLFRGESFLILRASSVGDLHELRIRHVAALRRVRRMYVTAAHRGVLAIHGAHSDEKEGRDEGRHHDDQQQHHQATHEARQAHADRLGIGRRGILYDHGGVVAGVRCAQCKVHVAWRDHLDDSRRIHIRHFLSRSLVHVGGEQGHRAIDILKIEGNRCNAVAARMLNGTVERVIDNVFVMSYITAEMY